MKWKILKWTLLTVLALAGAAVAWMGPRNVVGYLRYDQRVEGTLKAGDAAPDVTLVDLDGQTPVHLRQRLSAVRPIVIIFGSFT